MIAITKILNGATISGAAYLCGFSDISHFNKMLLPMFGMSPSQFIKKNSNKRVFICHTNTFVLETRFHIEKSWEIETLHKL
jgi:AraC-like DNA-binding protein